MAQGREFQRAIDRLVADLTRFAERAIAKEIEHAITQATARVDRRPRRQSTAVATTTPSGPSRSEVAALRRAEREAERKEREAARERRRQEREQLKEELLAAREAARSQRDLERDKDRQEKAAARLAKQQEREAEEAARLAPPPLVVFKRSRDGQVTVLQPRPVDEDAPKQAAVAQPSA